MSGYELCSSTIRNKGASKFLGKKVTENEETAFASHATLFSQFRFPVL
jgi:hypothetical protein